jgi:hypothetical protein
MLHRIKDYTDQDLEIASRCKNFTLSEHLEMIGEIELRRDTAAPPDVFGKRWNGERLINTR